MTKKEKRVEKKKRRSRASSHVPSYLLPEQFYQPGECEEAGWPDVTHIVASAFEGPGSSLSPGMGWLNRFRVFTCARPPGARFNLSHNKKVDGRTDGLWVWPQTMDEFFIKWLNWVASGAIFIHGSLFMGSRQEFEVCSNSRVQVFETLLLCWQTAEQDSYCRPTVGFEQWNELLSTLKHSHGFCLHFPFAT